MILHPELGAKTKITNVDDEMVQMHAVDIRMEQLFELQGEFRLEGENRVHRLNVELAEDLDGFFYIEPNSSYSFNSSHKCEMAAGECGYLITRSTLNRNGIIIKSGLYDAGYKGGINGLIINTTPYRAMIKKGERVAQFIIAEAQTNSLYQGVYNEA